MATVGWNDLPDSQVFENRFVQQILDWLQGRAFAPLQVVRDGVTLFEIPLSGGVTLSPDGVLQAGNYYALPGMALYWSGLVATVPPGWTVVAAAQDRFIWNANVDDDLGTTGGAQTINLQHHHTTSTHLHPHTATHTHPIPQDNGTTDGPNNPSTFRVRDDVETVTIPHPDHTHDFPHDHGALATARAPGSTDNNVSPADTGDTLSTTQNILPPFWRAWLIQRS